MAFIELPSDVSSVSVFTVSVILVLRSQEVLTIIQAQCKNMGMVDWT